MKWIRSPAWDVFWFLSAPILGLLMLVPVWLPHHPIVIGHVELLTLILFSVSLGHTVSPIILGWAHPEYRRNVLLRRPLKYLGIPTLVMITGAMVGVSMWLFFPTFHIKRVALENIDLNQWYFPFVVWANLYAVWNLYHSAAQDFGFFCLYRRRSLTGIIRYVTLGLCICLVIGVGHELPRLGGSPLIYLFFSVGLISANHYLAEIGLCAHVHARRTGLPPIIFAVTAIGIGLGLTMAMFCAIFYSPRMAILALALRGALGIWHFLADRWSWRMSDPAVRATIGRAIFA